MTASNETGAKGEKLLISLMGWVPRPKGEDLSNLLAVLADQGVRIKRTSFDAIELPEGVELNFADRAMLARWLPDMTFREIKSASQDRAGATFGSFLFTLSEHEIEAARQLGSQYVFTFFNLNTHLRRDMTLAEITREAQSVTRQVTIQFRKETGVPAGGGVLDLFTSDSNGAAVDTPEISDMEDLTAWAWSRKPSGRRKASRAQVEARWPIEAISEHDLRCERLELEARLKRAQRDPVPASEEVWVRRLLRLHETLARLSRPE